MSKAHVRLKLSMSIRTIPGRKNHNHGNCDFLALTLLPLVSVCMRDKPSLLSPRLWLLVVLFSHLTCVCTVSAPAFLLKGWVLGHFNFLQFFSYSSWEVYNEVFLLNYKKIESNAKKGHMEDQRLLGFLAFVCLFLSHWKCKILWTLLVNHSNCLHPWMKAFF